MNEISPNTVMAAMSGGVDSSVAARLLLDGGYSVIGATLQLWAGEESGNTETESACGSPDNVEDARAVCCHLGIEHLVFNFTDAFEKEVICRFAATYEAGETPNPCIACNRYMKFGRMLDRALTLGCEYLATGHYVRRERSPGDRWLLRKAADAAKDQSYVLYSLTQRQLAHSLFPLGELTKAEVRTLALNAGFLNARKHDSQDICFVPDGDYAAFLERRHGGAYPPGDFRTLEGHVLGRHRGLVRYTIGQRKGLGLALPAPLYVCGKNLADNTVTLAPNDALFTRTLEADDLNLIAFDRIDRPLRVRACVRYNQPEQWAILEQTDCDRVKLVFDEPQRAVAPGQAVVFYEDDYVVGGATIR